MKLSELEYSFPPELIANEPPLHREESRMMVVNPCTQVIEHKKFTDFPSHFRSGDVLVVNDSKVFPCRLLGSKPTGGKVECLLTRLISDSTWECMLTDSRKIPQGTFLTFGESLKGEVMTGRSEMRQIRFEYVGSFETILLEIGHIPLPPYIRRSDTPADRDRYQTVYAAAVGSIAAPTAGFHLTQEMLSVLEKKGVEIVTVTLHVGLGTFMPVRVEDLDEHDMHQERFVISKEAASTIFKAKKENRRVTAVGTTATRTLESAILPSGKIQTGEQETRLFIRPPYHFKVVDRLLTNFHQPKSTLLALVGSLMGMELMRRVYTTAIAERYRLFSYGDCMLIQNTLNHPLTK